MTADTIQSSDVSSVRASKIKLLLFFAIPAAVLIGGTISGYMLRDWIQGLGGPVFAEVINESDLKIRADLLMDEYPAMIEDLKPGESGIVRFNPKQAGPIQLRLFQGKVLLNTLEAGWFEPGKSARVRFTVESPDEIQVEYPDVSSQKSATP